MSVRSFHSVYMAGAVAAAALSCYLVSLRVASERASLDNVETQIVDAQRDIRMLQTEIGTRGRLGQLERWNASALSLSAPGANQFLRDSFQLAKLVKPEEKLNVEAPVVMAAAPAPPPHSALEDADPDVAESAPPAQLVHEASFKTIEPDRKPQVVAAKGVPVKAAEAADKTKTPLPKPITKTAETAPKPKPVPAKVPAQATIKLAEADPLAPLPKAGKVRPQPSLSPKSSSKDSHVRK